MPGRSCLQMVLDWVEGNSGVVQQKIYENTRQKILVPTQFVTQRNAFTFAIFLIDNACLTAVTPFKMLPLE